MNITREQWLHDAIDMLRPLFASVGAELPKLIHVSVGFAYGARRENKVIVGQTWSRSQSDDKVNQVFISPELKDRVEVLETLIHELVHVADDNKSGHKGFFAKVAIQLGMQRPMTETPSSPELQAELIVMSEELGAYPHAALHPAERSVRVPAGEGAGTPVKVHSGPPKQGSRLIKVRCKDCGYTARVARTWLNFGLPQCPDGQPMFEEEQL